MTKKLNFSFHLSLYFPGYILESHIHPGRSPFKKIKRTFVRKNGKPGFGNGNGNLNRGRGGGEDSVGRHKLFDGDRLFSYWRTQNQSVKYARPLPKNSNECEGRFLRHL